ncbi:MAG TPA: hypothetical protein VIJ95_14290 [Hanamia sp.]
MTTTAIRKKLMTYIADADDKKVKGLYMLIEDDISSKEKFEFNDEQVKMLEQDRNEHIKGKSKSYSREDAKQIVLPGNDK